MSYRVRYIGQSKGDLLLAGPFEVSLPSFASVTLGLVLDLLLVRLSVDPPAHNDDITTTVENHLFRSPVLLPHLVSLDIQPDSRREDHKVLVLCRTGRVFLVNTLHGNESKDEAVIAMSSSHLDGLFGVFPRREVALAGHLGEQQEASVERLSDRGETGNDTIAGDRMGVGDMRPVCDLVYSGRVLQGDGVTCTSEGHGGLA